MSEYATVDDRTLEHFRTIRRNALAGSMAQVSSDRARLRMVESELERRRLAEIGIEVES